MIDIEKAKKEFMNYANNYDKENRKIILKISHSFRVMEQSKKIAESLSLDDEQVNLATLIGLLHDIARFEQMRRFGTYVDSKSIDHGDLGAEILSDKNFIRKFIDEDKYDYIIITAIKNHNKFKIQEGLSEEALLQSKIIRDADKIDILYEATESFWYTEEEEKLIENSPVIKQEYFEQIKANKPLLRNGDNTKLECIISYLAFVFDFNFKYTFKFIQEKEYINKILNRFNFKNSDTELQVKEIKEIINEYVLSKI